MVNIRRLPIVFSASLLALSLTVGISAQTFDRAAVVRAIDSIVNEPIDGGQIAGASVAAVHGTDTIIMKAYGYADLEYHVPTPDGAIYEIGSVTKQFTAAAILQLVAAGSIDLDAVFTEYLPDYPAEAHGITVRRLMDHTSGIKGYTEMPGFESIATRALPRDSLVVMFSAAPLDFRPGDAMIYNNSAYFLLGLIIEAVTGETYEDYVSERLFTAANMPDSRYCSSNTIVERRAHGYDFGPDGLARKSFIDHTWPYSAGSLCSTARDLTAWNEALHGDGEGGYILDAAGYRELTTPGSLNDGTQLRYAKGLAVFETGGRRVIGHGGGIPGFLSQVNYYPDEDLSVVVLVNSTGPPGPGAIATEIARLILGEPPDDPVREYADDVEMLTGAYRGPGRGGELTITVDKDPSGLTASVGDGEAFPLRFVEDLTFATDNNLYTFVVEDGEVVRLLVDQLSGLYVLTPAGG